MEKSHHCEEDSFKDNNKLIISEKEQKIYLPYTISEVNKYIAKYPEQFEDAKQVIENEFILPITYFMSHPIKSRFREGYSLIRDKEAKSVFEALKFGTEIMFKYNLNPAIVSACRTQEMLETYLKCLELNDFSEFNFFEIEFKVNPLKISKLVEKPIY